MSLDVGRPVSTRGDHSYKRQQTDRTLVQSPIICPNGKILAPTCLLVTAILRYCPVPAAGCKQQLTVARVDHGWQNACLLAQILLNIECDFGPLKIPLPDILFSVAVVPRLQIINYTDGSNDSLMDLLPLVCTNLWNF